MNGVYEFMIFSPKGELLFFEDYTRKKILQRRDGNYIFNQETSHRFENINGICEAFKFILSNLSPSPIYGFNNYTTNKYKFSILELPTKLKFILISDTDIRDYDPLLKSIYSEIYVNSVTRNILNRTQKIQNFEDFRQRINDSISNFK